MPECSACGAPTSVQYGRLYTPEDPEYPYMSRETSVFDADEPTRKHVCDAGVLRTHLGRLRMAAVPDTPPVLETRSKRIQRQQEASEEYRGEL